MEPRREDQTAAYYNCPILFHRALEVSDKNKCNKNDKITTKQQPEPRGKGSLKRGQENNVHDYMYVVGG